MAGPVLDTPAVHAFAPAWIEISQTALEHNFRTLASLAPASVLVAPVVKANAYGHGARLVAEVLAASGAAVLCVHDVAEAVAVADLGCRVLVLGPIWPWEAETIAKRGLEVVVAQTEPLAWLSAEAVRVGRDIGVHVKIETGTHRQGAAPAAATTLAAALQATPGLRWAGVSTHLADVEDETEHSFARVQLDRFHAAMPSVPPSVLRHVAASAGHLVLPGARYDLVRVGIATYGLWPSAATRIATDLVHGPGAVVLQPAMAWRARLASVESAAAGEWVGYGRSIRLSRPTRVGLLPVGYYDGYDRGLSNVADVLVHGRRCRVLGRVCMNLTMVDVTDVAKAAAGDVVTLIGRDPDTGANLPVEELSERLGTIPYEVVSRIHERLPRVLVP